MEWASKEILGLIYSLLPGFVAAWVFYGLTTHPKKESFERVVQALIFTVIIQVGVNCLGGIFLFIGRHFFVLGTWSEKVALGWSIIIAVLFGVILSAMANRDTIHRWLREGKHVKKLRITSRHSFPSEWFSAFQRENRFIVLQLKDGRRLQGWPEEWPNSGDDGHFLLTSPHWVYDGVPIPLLQNRRMIIAASLVEWVEVLLENEERSMTVDAIATIQKPLIESHEAKNGDTKCQTVNQNITSSSQKDVVATELITESVEQI